jgi:hypothetical protein
VLGQQCGFIVDALCYGSKRGGVQRALAVRVCVAVWRSESNRLGSAELQVHPRNGGTFLWDTSFGQAWLFDHLSQIGDVPGSYAFDGQRRKKWNVSAKDYGVDCGFLLMCLDCLFACCL